ncbi:MULTISPECIES: hypothetical protein [Nocardioides]|uniref:Uncharacterized protein n=1 Tax=Nocardioides vastitatis TaxID=2568655 RepID=A0ABW0ZNU3_9ACTN|nr:hypothetical protein [Nocardioides sp.]THJ13712.1 hypothetical protein E7Z54_01505 [Nocardioides sp.]
MNIVPPEMPRQVVSYSEQRISGDEVATVSGVAAVRVKGRAVVFASGAARVRADGHSTVYAFDAANVTASGNARVYASNYAVVRAYGSAVVEARSHVTVYANGKATVRAFGTGTVVHDLSPDARVFGGSQVVPDVHRHDAADWCERNGVTVTDGVATLYRAVDENWRTANDELRHCIDYTPGSMPVAPDWNPDLPGSRGGGLFFSPSPFATLSCVPPASKALRFVSAGVLVCELVPTTNVAAKAPRVVSPSVAVDLAGQPVPWP